MNKIFLQLHLRIYIKGNNETHAWELFPKTGYMESARPRSR